MIRNKYVALALYVIFTLVFYNALDYYHKTFVTGTGYHFTLSTDLITPVLMGICFYFLTSFRRR